jgi:hypothetical protein
VAAFDYECLIERGQDDKLHAFWPPAGGGTEEPEPDFDVL